MSNLNELRDKLAEEFCIEMEYRFEYAKSWEENAIIFNSGWSALLNHLEGAPGEFDVDDVMLQIANTPPDDWTSDEVDKFMIGARWQFDQCKARIGLIREAHNLASTELLKSYEVQNQMDLRIKSLEDKLALAEQDRDSWKSSFLIQKEAANKLIADFEDKLATANARILELEKQLPRSEHER